MEGWSRSGQSPCILLLLYYSATQGFESNEKQPNFKLAALGLFITCLSVSLAGECGRRGVEFPELGGEGDANVEEVMEGVMYPLPTLSRPSEEGGSDEASRATLLTRLSISPALSSVLSFSSWISLRDKCTFDFISTLDLLLFHNLFHCRMYIIAQTLIKKPLN